MISTLFFFGPLYLYLTNTGEFEYGLSDILPAQALLTTFLFIIMVLLFSLLPRRFFRLLLVLAATCGFLFWLQGQVIVWKYGALDGQNIVWSGHIFKGVIDSAIWIAVFALAAVFRRQLYPWVRRIAFFFILLQAGLLLALFLKNPSAWKAGPAPGNEKSRYDFSPEKNVLLLVLDEFQSDVFADIVSREQDYLSMFDGFTYFRNSVGSYMCTAAAIPFIMTGQYFDNTEPRSHYIQRSYASRSIPERLRAKGFRLDLYPRSGFADMIYMPQSWRRPEPPKSISWRALIPAQAFLMDITMFRYSPHFIKPLFYRRQEWLFSRWARRILPDAAPAAGKLNSGANLSRRFSRELVQLNLDFDFVNGFLSQAHGGSPEPVFKYYHWNAVHVPLRFDENFQIVNRESNRANFTSQAKACLKMVGLVLGKLKELNIYDQTLIIILSDHGSGRTKDMFINPLFNEYSRFLSNGDPHRAFHFSKSRGVTLFLVKPIQCQGKHENQQRPSIPLGCRADHSKRVGN